MSNIDFGYKATTYEENGLVQRKAANTLLELLNIPPGGNVLDLGCWPGGITSKIATLTSGKVLGVDVSAGMINQAKKSQACRSNLDFQVRDAADLGFDNFFDAIFCNSAFQWFKEPSPVINSCWQALKPGGTMTIQATATSNYCPVFIAAIRSMTNDDDTGPIFAHWQSPFLFLDSAEEYSRLFKAAGFTIDHSELKTETNYFSVEQVYGIFNSGAENGYLNQAYYSVAINDGYIERCRQLVRNSFQQSADQDGRVELSFTRIYLAARKPD